MPCACHARNRTHSTRCCVPTYFIGLFQFLHINDLTLYNNFEWHKFNQIDKIHKFMQFHSNINVSFSFINGNAIDNMASATTISITSQQTKIIWKTKIIKTILTQSEIIGFPLTIFPISWLTFLHFFHPPIRTGDNWISIQYLQSM